MLMRLAASIGDKRWFRPFAQRVLPRVDRVLLRFGWRASPWPTLLLTTTGRKTGVPRKAPLYFVAPAGGLAVIASNYGGEEPDWSKNLGADPACLVTLRRRVTRRIARRATEEEWQELFERFADFYPSYREYRKRAHRHIPIWILEAEA